MSALFGGSTRASGKNLLEFKAGKMNLRGKMVHPDKRKGQVFLYQADDSLMHFCWKDRTAGSVEEDLIIFPDDCEYKRISQCTTGRVYVLRFKSTNRRLFFWMQEPKTDKDDEHCRKVNELLNNPPTPGSRNPTGSSSSSVLPNDLPSLRDSDLQSLFNTIPHQQLMQILGSGVPSLTNLLNQSSGGSRSNSASSGSTTTASTTGSTSVTSTTTSSSTPSTTTTTTTSSANAGQGAVAVDLGSAMNSEALQSILTNEEFVEQLKPLLPPTEEKLPPVEQLRGTVSSPQFRQAVTTFSHALQSGQLGPLINQFGLGEEAVMAASSCDMEAFVKALEKRKEKETGGKDTGNKNTEKDKDKDEDTEESTS